MEQRTSIGIFDSGMGGLTVAAAINKLLPNESMIYVGDLAHFPYGDKSPESIKGYSLKIAKFLLEQNCKVVVIACNTASSHAFKYVSELAQASGVTVINVIDPAVKAITKQFKSGKIGIIGTRGTISAGVYPRKIKRVNPNLDVTSLATPLLAPMIEEGFFNNKISKTIIESYLSKKSLAEIDALILGCTHYPLIRKEIETFYKGSVIVFDSAEMVALEVKRELAENNLLAHENNVPSHRFLVTDFTPEFERSTRYFFPGTIELNLLPLWNE